MYFQYTHFCTILSSRFPALSFTFVLSKVLSGLSFKDLAACCQVADHIPLITIIIIIIININININILTISIIVRRNITATA